LSNSLCLFSWLWQLAKIKPIFLFILQTKDLLVKRRRPFYHRITTIINLFFLFQIFRGKKRLTNKQALISNRTIINPKSKAQNPKQYQNSNDQNPKQKLVLVIRI